MKISGRGLYGSSGKNVSDFFTGLKRGESSIKLIENWKHLPIRMASILQNQDFTEEEIKVVQSDIGIKRSLMIQKALYEALNSAGMWSGEPWNVKPYLELVADEEFSSHIRGLPQRVGVFLGVGVYPTSETLVQKIMSFGQDRGWDYFGQSDYKEVYLNALQDLSANLSFSELELNSLNFEQCAGSALIRHLLGSKTFGPDITISNLCVSSMQAIGQAYRALQAGTIDLAVVGGIEEYSFLSSFSFASLGAYSDVNLVEEASRPFDKKRQGLVLGEGCGLIILEKNATLKARNHYALAEVKGYAGSNNRFHMTSSPSTGEGLQRAISECWDMAGNPEIDLVIAHGTGTLNNDSSETKAIQMTQLGFPLVQSIKSYTGHTLASAGIYNVIAGLVQQENSFFSHTLHLDEPDSTCYLNHIQKGGLTFQADTMILNAAGFGGMNACLLIKF